MKKTSPLISFLVLITTSLTCTIGVSAPQSEPNSATIVAMTLTAVSLQNPQAPSNNQPATPPSVVPPTAITQAVAPPTSAVAPASAIPPTKTAPCDRASFVTETIPDNTKMKPGQTFDKKWTIKNNGSCPWVNGYTIVFDRGDAMGVQPVSPLTAGTIQPGKNIEVALTLTAPNNPGTYQGFFMLKNSSGKKFGIGDNADQAFWVKIVVEKAASQAPAVYKSGMLEIPQTWTVDLDNGSIGPASGADIYYEVDINSSHNLVFYGPAKLFSKQPSFEDCNNAQMDSPTVPIVGMSLGTYYCYLTDEGRLGYLDFAGYDSTVGASKLYLEYTTWKK